MHGETGKRHGFFTGWVRACAWSGDGTRVLSAAGDHTLRIWDADSGGELRVLTGHDGWVLACAWSGDGTRVLSAGDGTLRIWDADSGRAILLMINGASRQAAAIDVPTKRITYASPEAWRFLGWRYFDEELGYSRVLPAEYFGPLPDAQTDQTDTR